MRSLSSTVILSLLRLSYKDIKALSRTSGTAKICEDKEVLGFRIHKGAGKTRVIKKSKNRTSEEAKSYADKGSKASDQREEKNVYLNTQRYKDKEF